MRRFTFLLLVVAGALLIAAPGAFASATTETFITKDGTDTFPAVNPCTGVPGTETITFNAVVHITDLGPAPNGTEIVFSTGATTGTYVLVPDDPSQPTFTGHFEINLSLHNITLGLAFSDTETVRIAATGSDGSRLLFHDVFHITTTPDGDISVYFDRPTCV